MRIIPKCTLLLATFLASSFAYGEKLYQENAAAPDLQGFQVSARAENARYISFRETQLQQHFLKSQGTFDFSIPTPDGQNLAVVLIEDSVMASALAAKFPSIKSYKAINKNGKQIGRFSFSPKGIHGMYRHNNEWAYIDPMFVKPTNQYISYYKKDAQRVGVYSFNEIFSKSFDSRNNRLVDVDLNIENAEQLAATGDTLTTYRLAVSVTAEYTEFHGATVEMALAAINVVLNRINQVFLKDLAVQFQLVNGNDAIIFTDAETDPFNNNSDDIDLNQAVVDSAIGVANYDIGHVFTTSDGGVAALGSVCGSSKAEGLTGLPSPTGDSFYIDYVAHEIGHQFDGGHSYNGTGGACGNQRSASTAWEPGSGSTIMSYASICPPQNLQDNSDDFFHIGSVEQIRSFIENGRGNTCGSTTALDNTRPTVDAGEDYSIPSNTPFILSGTGSDPDGDTLIYNWEQLDLGTESSNLDTMVDDGSRPLFRSWPGTSEPKRYLPRFNDVLRATTTIGEAYPRTSRNLNFRLTARDGKGGVNTDAMVVTSVENPIGFRLVIPSADTGWSAGNNNVLVWNPAESAKEPVNCSTVDLDISSDGGNSFSSFMSGIENDGVTVVTAPSDVGSDYRLRLKCSDNIFYTVSQSNFSITAASSVTDSDNDGLPDSWETENGFSPDDASDALIDSDQDGLSNLEEYLLSTDPNNADTDGDGIGDLLDTTGEVSAPEPIVVPEPGNDPGNVPYDFETSKDLGNWDFTFSKPWALTAEEAASGTFSLVSANVSDNELSEVSLTEILPAGILSFDYQVSSEIDYDFLEFYVDGELVRIWSGLVDWSNFQYEIEAGLHTLRWRYIKDADVTGGFDKAWIDNVELSVGSSFDNELVSFSFENGTDIERFDLPSDNSWITSTDIAFEGEISLSSATITHEQRSSFSITDEFVAGELSFYIRVSSEFGYDFLNFYIDGTLVSRWSGDVDWKQVVQYISAGEHTLTWTYVKDRDVSDFQDKAWVDLISLPLASANSLPDPTDSKVAFDFDNDNKADIAVRRGSSFFQYINYSGSDDIGRVQFGRNVNDIPVTGDFDGDGIFDVAVRRPSSHFWYIKNSSGEDKITGNSDGITRRAFGLQEADIPVPADYDGDGITDIAVRRPSTQYWYILNSSGVDEISNNSDGITRIRFGLQEQDIPVVADFDGDGKADLAVRRPGTQFWYVRNSSGTDAVTGNADGITRLNFGLQESDIPVVADFDGDGKADFAVRRPSGFFWYIKNSSGTDARTGFGDGISRVQFGLNVDDIPVVADYDGDGKADIAVRRASNQIFYIQNSSGSNFNSSNEDGIQRVNFGLQEADIPLAAPVLTRMAMAASN